MKLDAGGNVAWERTYGGAAQDEANSVQPTRDGGYIVAGYTKSLGAGGRDAWVLKLDASGNIMWQKTYGGADDDNARQCDRLQMVGILSPATCLPRGH